MRTVILLLLLYVIEPAANAQNCSTPFRIVVLGSSTAAGMGATPNHGWVALYTAYLKTINTAYQVHNLAVGGYTTYDICPTGFVPPASRPVPDTAHNITKALSLNPDAIIINLPTNDVGRGYTLLEQQNNYKRIVAAATARGVKVWVTSTQPRNDYSAQMVANLKAMRDWTFSYFGDRSLDFWSGMSQPNDSIKWAYSYGDGIHLNNAGHQVLYTRAVARNIPTVLCGNSAAVTLSSFTLTKPSGKFQLNWTTTYEKAIRRFIVEQSVDSLSWSNIGNVPATGSTTTTTSYQFLDPVTPATVKYYRLNIVGIDSSRRFSNVLKGIPDSVPANTYFNITNFTVYQNQNKLTLYWYSNNEKNTSRFIIERSSDSANWTSVGTLAAAGNYPGSRYYSFTDNNIYTVLQYYRLNMVTTSELHFYSTVIKGMPDTMYTQPFRLSTFTSTVVSGKAQLKWSTTAEKNTKNFTVERSTDSITWKTAGTVNAAGNSTTLRNYSYNDTMVLRTATFYRLNMLTHDNRRFYSKVIKVLAPPQTLAYTLRDNSNAVMISLSPNPATAVYRINGLSADNHTVRVYDLSGRLVYINRQFRPGNTIAVEDWPAGTYITIIDEGAQRIKLIKH